MTNNSPLPQSGFLRLPAILELIPIGKSTWWAGVKTGRFPKPVKLGPNTTAWRVEDINAVLRFWSGGSAGNDGTMPPPAAPPSSKVTDTSALEWVNRVGR